MKHIWLIIISFTRKLLYQIIYSSDLSLLDLLQAGSDFHFDMRWMED